MTPPIDLPYVKKLGQDADGFANLLSLLALAGTALVIGWMVGDWIGWWGAVPPNVLTGARFFAIAWLVFYGLAALIDYTIYAVIRCFFEILDGFLNSPTPPAPANDEESMAPSATDQRDSAVAYLRDYLKLPRQAHAERAEPAEPPPAA